MAIASAEAMARGEARAYCVLGANASGKSTLLKLMVPRAASTGAHAELVSFEGHRAVLREFRGQYAARVLGRRLNPVCAPRLLRIATQLATTCGARAAHSMRHCEPASEPGPAAHRPRARHLSVHSQAAKYLVMRFGLYRLLSRRVEQLSTGEIRKLLLARALSSRPRLLLLDNAFDGLDSRARDELREHVGQTARGFGEMLVQGAGGHLQVRCRCAVLLRGPRRCSS